MVRHPHFGKGQNRKTSNAVKGSAAKAAFLCEFCLGMVWHPHFGKSQNRKTSNAVQRSAAKAAFLPEFCLGMASPFWQRPKPQNVECDSGKRCKSSFSPRVLLGDGMASPFWQRPKPQNVECGSEKRCKSRLSSRVLRPSSARFLGEAH